MNFQDFINAEQNVNESIVDLSSSVADNSSNLSSFDSSIIDITGSSDSFEMDSNNSGQFVTVSSVSDATLINDSLDEVNASKGKFSLFIHRDTNKIMKRIFFFEKFEKAKAIEIINKTFGKHLSK